MIKKIVSFFDRLEDKVRIRLSRAPILYALIGAIGIILVWKGVWEVAELVPALHGFGSAILGVLILLITGLFVSFFIGDSIIISGFRREKKLAERTEHEVETEKELIEDVSEDVESEKQLLTQVVQKLDRIEKEVQELTDR